MPVSNSTKPKPTTTTTSKTPQHSRHAAGSGQGQPTKKPYNPNAPQGLVLDAEQIRELAESHLHAISPIHIDAIIINTPDLVEDVRFYIVRPDGLGDEYRRNIKRFNYDYGVFQKQLQEFLARYGSSIHPILPGEYYLVTTSLPGGTDKQFTTPQEAFSYMVEKRKLAANKNTDMTIETETELTGSNNQAA
jgi:hypothetical protein